MMMCATKGHEKVPAVSMLTVEGKEIPHCAECEQRRFLQQRAAQVAYKLMAPPENA